MYNFAEKHDINALTLWPCIYKVPARFQFLVRNLPIAPQSNFCKYYYTEFALRPCFDKLLISIVNAGGD